MINKYLLSKDVDQFKLNLLFTFNEIFNGNPFINKLEILMIFL